MSVVDRRELDPGGVLADHGEDLAPQPVEQGIIGLTPRMPDLRRLQRIGGLVAEQFATIDQYIGSFPEDVQIVIREVRRRIRNVVPEAGETISYRIPTMTLNGRHLVYFAAWKHHISLYPVPAADEAFERELAPYLAGKGTVRLPLHKPIPYDLIERLVTLLVQERHGHSG